MTLMLLEKPKAVSAEVLVKETTGTVSGLSAEDLRSLRDIGYSNAESNDQSVRLLDFLHGQGVPVYRPEDVEKYKSSMRRRAAYSRRKWYTRTALLALSLAAVATANTGLVWSHVSLVIAGYVSLWVPAVAATALYLNDYGAVSVYWDEKAISRYNKPIPTSVLAQVARLYRVNPGLTFIVSDLFVEQKVWDPILYVRWGIAEYAIAVWDEPNFNAKLL